VPRLAGVIGRQQDGSPCPLEARVPVRRHAIPSLPRDFPELLLGDDDDCG
jgi:hypothetical protein